MFLADGDLAKVAEEWEMGMGMGGGKRAAREVKAGALEWVGRARVDHGHDRTGRVNCGMSSLNEASGWMGVEGASRGVLSQRRT